MKVPQHTDEKKVLLRVGEVPFAMRKPLAPYATSLRGCFLSVLAPLTIRGVCCEAASGTEISVLPWEHKQTWPCNGHFSCSSHLCWQYQRGKSSTPTPPENLRKQVGSAHSCPHKLRFLWSPATGLLCILPQEGYSSSVREN